MAFGRVPVSITRGLRRRRNMPTVGDSTRGVCNAPFASMYLDQHGFVRACCMNDFHVLGNVKDLGLREIWRGLKAEELRAAMKAHDLSLGCEFCKWQVDEGRADLAFLRWFADFEPSEDPPLWPQQLELSISNTCNLQCVMCNGEWSSSIRTLREHRPPLEKVYSDSFFDDLREFLPDLKRIKLLGGEPFLATETMRVMNLLIDEGAHIRCHVTTNGTQMTSRVERVLEELLVDVAVSVDASTEETYEKIRVGSRWTELLGNLDRFREISRSRGTDLTLTFCLMVANWRDFVGFCEMADALDLGCAVNTVTQPSHLSLYHLPLHELEVVLDELERIEDGRARSLGRSRATWFGELERLRQHADHRRRSVVVTGLERRRINPDAPRPFPETPTAGDSSDDSSGSGLTSDVDASRSGVGGAPLDVRAAGGDDVGLGQPPTFDGTYLVLDHQQAVCSVEGGSDLIGIPASAFLGRRLDELADVVSPFLGAVSGIAAVETTQTHQVFAVRFGGDREALAVLVAEQYGPDPTPARLSLAWRDPSGA